MLRASSVDAWKLLWRLAAAACSSTSCGSRPIHTQLLAHAHVLRRPEILQNVLHVLIIVCACAWASTKSCLIVQASMRPLDAHVSNAAR